ncbi:DUF6303 family protein [Streptomyces sp. NBC_00885]|uniref:DUF6303 family protein n=1 Tax=Streptomyces sp. NBC_00885 TaxID=2975857 RepID=UPI0038666246|nr:DUF6303 family protein [Streptomyces sp. NBC_00885]
MEGTFTAQMSASRTSGRWRLYVVLLGVPVSQWPERAFGSAVVPTVQERSRALNALGYALTDGAQWEWTEDSETPDDPSSAVLLIASVTVREATE